jgi:hypothetical protein
MTGKDSTKNIHCKELQLMMEYKYKAMHHNSKMPESQFELVLNRIRMSMKKWKTRKNTYCKELQLMMEYKWISIQDSRKMPESQSE